MSANDISQYQVLLSQRLLLHICMYTIQKEENGQLSRKVYWAVSPNHNIILALFIDILAWINSVFKHGTLTSTTVHIHKKNIKALQCTRQLIYKQN